MDNGIKFFSNDGYKLPDELEAQMEVYIASGELDDIRPTAAGVGKAYRIDDAVGRYIEFIKNSCPKGMTLDGLKLVLDVANGAPYKVAPRIFTELGADVVVFNDKPNGMNINDHCGALYPEVVRKGVIDHRADVGISLDGDGDRCIMADDDATVVDGDHVLTMAALDMKAKGCLARNAIAATVMSNLGLFRAMEEAGIGVHRTQVGDRYVIGTMRAEGLNLGGEQSGHVIFSDYTTTGDGLITALQILRIMRETGRKLSDLRRAMRRYPQVLVNVAVRDKPPIESLDGVQAAVRRVEQHLGRDGRVLVRYSGTEYLARIMVEGREEREVKAYAEQVADAFRAALE
jgi:phosphoglucosamine mutase